MFLQLCKILEHVFSCRQLGVEGTDLIYSKQKQGLAVFPSKISVSLKQIEALPPTSI